VAVVLDTSRELERQDFTRATTTLDVPASMGSLFSTYMRQVIEFPWETVERLGQ
jgi:hypothetical protein